MDLAQIPTLGWAVIAFVASLTFIVLLLLIRKGIKLGKGSNFVSVGGMDKRLDEFKKEIDKKEKARLQDEEKRKELFRQSGIIDEKTKADQRRAVRKLYDVIHDIFAPYIKCEMPAIYAAEIIKDELLERIDYNCMREKLARHERAGYIQDIMYNIRTSYKNFLTKIPRLPCEAEDYPTWESIRAQVLALVNTWADEMTKIICDRVEEKIEMYTAARESFLLPESVGVCVDFPIRKNKKYLKDLQR